MGLLNYTTAETNNLLDKVNEMPDEVKDGKTPVFVIGTVSTLDPGMSATASVTLDGTDDQGNPKYKLNLGIPKGLDGASSGGGGVADSVQWTNVLNKPSWIGSTKPTYTATEVGALPASTTIPSKVSQLSNDIGYLTSSGFKTINGQSIVGSGNIVIESSGGGGTPSGDGGNVKVTNASILDKNTYYAFKPATNGSTEGTFVTIPYANDSQSGLMGSGDKTKLDDIKGLCKFPLAVASLTNNSTSEEILQAAGVVSSQAAALLYMMLLFSNAAVNEYDVDFPQAFIGNTPANMRCTFDSEAQSGTMELTYVASGGKLRTITISGKQGGTSPDYTYTYSCAITESGDDTYYLPDDVYNLEIYSSHEDILAAFGGSLGAIVAAIKENKHIMIAYNLMGIINYNYPVSAYRLGSNAIRISFYDVLYGHITEIHCVLTSTELSKVKKIYTSGYSLPASLYALTSSSTSDEISTAVGGESGMKAIIQALKDGNRLKGEYVIPESNPRQSVELTVTSSAYVEGDNGDLSLLLGSEAFVVMGFIRIGIAINYIKSSNTFFCVVTTD